MPSLLEDDKLATGVTSRSRRRRKPTNSEKENVSAASSGDNECIPAPSNKTKTKTTKKAPSSRKATTTTKRAAKKKPSKNTLGASEQSCVWKYATYQPKEDVLDCFREALDTIPLKEVETWKQDERLTKILVEASLSLPEISESAITLYLLEDETMSRNVLSTCRKIVKLVAGNATKSKADQVEGSLQGLFASVHGLRALSALSPEIARSEAILRLLYHLITTGSGLLTNLHEQKAKATTKKANSKFERLMELAETTCFAGYQAMCHILEHLSISSGKSAGKIIEFGILNNDNHPSQWSSLFPLPTLVESHRQASSSTMTLAQVFTISVQSTLAIAKTMANSSLLGTGPFSCMTNPPTGNDNEFLTAAQNAAVYLLKGVGLYWASVVSNEKIADKDGAIAKETISFCQQAHRILWELSSRISKTLEGQEGRDACLELKNQALLILLAQSSGHASSNDSLHMQSSTGKYLRKKHFENVCTMASKISANYFQQQQQSPVERSVLTEFHLDLGNTLDSAASYLPENPESLPYVEYCAHRALHVRRLAKNHDRSLCRHDKSPCHFSDINLSYSHREPMIADGDIHRRPLSITLSLFFVTLQLQDNIRQAISKSEKDAPTVAEHPPGLVDTSLIRAIIQNFQSVFLAGAESYSLDVMLGCFKLLTLVPLHSTIFKLSSLPSQDLVNLIENANLCLAAEILALCIGPFTAQLLANSDATQDAKKEAYMQDLVVECFARAGTLWDTLHAVEAPTDAISHSEYSESAFLKLADFIDSIDFDSAVSRNLIEKSAKIFASLGKRRASRNERKAALDPLLRSILLFNGLASDEDNKSKYNIAARWSMITGIFQSIGWTDAASLATVLTITSNISSFSCMGAVGETENRFNDVLVVLGSSTHGIVETGGETLPGSDINRMCIRHLIDNLLENGGETSGDCNPLSTKGAIELLLAVTLKGSARKGEGSEFSRLYTRQVGYELTMVSLLRAVCGGDTGVVHVELVKLLVTILEVCGKTMQRASEAPSKEALACYEGIATFLVELLCSLPDTQEEGDNDSAAILSATALVAASSSLLVESAIFNNISLGTPVAKADNQVDHSASLLPLAVNLANQASQIIGDERQHFYEKNRLVSAVRSATTLYRRNLLAVANHASYFNNNDDDIIVVDEDTLATFSSGETDSKMTKSARICMSWTLGRLRDRLSFQGDRLHASQIAIWHNCLVANSDGIRKQWANALATNTLLVSGLLDVALESQEIQESNRNDGSKTVDDESDIESDLWACWQTLVSTEQQVVHLRLQLCSGRTSGTEYIEELLNKKLNDAESIQSESNSDIVVAAMSWIRSSILFVLSEADEANGDFQQAVSRVRMCYQACQEVIASEDVLKSRAPIAASDNLTRMILPSLVIRSFEKRIECLQRTANLYARLGDHRRCTAYAFSALKSCNNPGILAELTPKLKVRDLLSLFRRIGVCSLQEESCRRQMIWLKALSSTNSIVASEFLNTSQDNCALIAGGQVRSAAHHVRIDRLSELEDHFTIGNYLHVSNACQGETIDKLYGRASQLYERIVEDPWYQQLLESFATINPSLRPDRLFTPAFFELQLGVIRTLLADAAGANEKEIAAKCLNIANAKAAPRGCRGWALYYLGLSELETARKTGVLSKLWSGWSNIIDDGVDNSKRRSIAKCIKNARSHFLAALPLAGPASELLTRNVLRCLALVTGPECDSKNSSMSTCLLIHTSIGCTARQELSRRLSGDNDVANALKALDRTFKSTEEREAQVDQLFSILGQCAEPGWRFVATTVCPTGEILLTSLSIDGACNGFRAETACIFPMAEESNYVLYDAILKPLDAIIRKSQQQLGGITTASDANTKFSDTSLKRGWWNERKKVDGELQDLLGSVERNFFDSPSVRQVLFGCDESPFLDDSFESSDSGDSASMICGNLSSKFDAVYETPRRKSRGRSSKVVVDDESDKFRKDSVSSKRSNTSGRSNRRTRSADSSSFGSCTGSYRKQAPRTSLPTHSNNEGGNCTFVILDENLHRFPIEGLPSFAGHSVCRLPSLSFALAPFFQASLSKPEMPVIDPVNGRYIIDPESNLGATQERLLPFVEKIAIKHSWKWNGVVGEMPSPEFMEESLQQESGLLLFCGHGGGQRCFSRSQIERLADNEVGDSQKRRGCRSSVVLMGCSSGKLESVNRKGSDSISNETIFYEPEGIALSYLLAGAPCVVANLWDVTDHDTDRYCLDLLERVLESPTRGKNFSMAQAVSEARAVCKMKYIVGCAPVCYGLPVSLLDNSSEHKPRKKRAGAKR